MSLVVEKWSSWEDDEKTWRGGD